MKTKIIQRSSFLLLILLIVFILELFLEFTPKDWLYTNNLFKQHKEYTVQKNFKRNLIVSNRTIQLPYQQFNKNPDLIFQKTKKVFKERAQSTKVALVEINGKEYVAKKYAQPSRLRWIRKVSYRGSKAYRAWHHAFLLSQIGIPTARQEMLIETKWGRFWKSGYILYEYLDGLTAEEYFDTDSGFQDSWDFTLLEIRKILTTLDDHSIINGDLTLRNIMIINSKPILIDLDRVHPYRFKHPLYKRRYRKEHVEKLIAQLKKLNPEKQRGQPHSSN